VSIIDMKANTGAPAASTSSLCRNVAGLFASLIRRRCSGVYPVQSVVPVLAEPQLSQWLATFGIEPIEAGCRRTVDPRREIERRTVAPCPQVAPEGRLAGQPGALLHATAVSLLGNLSHQLQYVALVAIREVEESPLRNPLATSLTTASFCQHQVPAMLVSDCFRWPTA
jgi:hypothetical protein